ncbi:MAG: PIG-L family deacetylase [Bacteroidetes bacterium]|nr:PIG-L family deacetylase [Bacteroidota bacterium]MDA1120085.1 PIG-L family deacetylase [Bacteroidota bacterium]
MKRSFKLVVVLLSIAASAFAQKPKQLHPGEIKQALNKLNVVGSVLYLAAHPDDENTRLIAFYQNEKRYNAAYLSCTRGDGGQNLIGPEIRELLGVIRTQELLAARRTDGGQQFFTRANDFGYSKTADETLKIWNKDEVLSDIVWTIRKHKPDVIITRFPPDERAGHGHHTSSAMLGIEAFNMAGDKTKYPEQLKYVTPWQPKRIAFNTHPFFFSRRGQPFDSTEYISMESGDFNPMLGKSYGEMAAESRTNHKSQGFGATGSRGEQKEYLKLLDGEPFIKDLFEDIDTGWSRVEGGESFAGYAESASMNFDTERPWIIISDLVNANKALPEIKDQYWREIKGREVREIIKAITGLYMEVKASDFAFSPGDSISLSTEIINRSPVSITLSSLNFRDLGGRIDLNQQLTNNSPFLMDKSGVVPANQPFSQPYWLIDKSTMGMYKVKDQLLRGLPENPPVFTVEVTIQIDGQYFDYEIPIIYKSNDPVDGESYRPLEIGPPVTLNINEKVYVFGDDAPKTIEVKIKSNRNNQTGSVSLDLPVEWRSEPQHKDFSMSLSGSEENITFLVYPPKSESFAYIRALATIDGKTYDNSLIRIEYDHIPIQTLFPTSASKLVKLNIERRGQSIAYIAGTGDEIPESLEQIGYDVDQLTDEQINPANLADYDAVITGVRAYNTVDRLKFHQEKLLNYVENGGTMIVQYNTSGRLVTDQLGPYPLELGRDRVSVEEAEIRILKPDHPVLNFPNKITQSDFDNWVQERGLYFPSSWDSNFEAILSSNDPGEDPRDGGLLVAKYGKGYYIYTGYSWFRQLPAGVPGAYRIFTNMISIGKENISTSGVND